jgi:chemotaxis protein CheD
MTHAQHQIRLTNVIQGGVAVGDHPQEVLVTILGSCVATCLHDPVAGIGGLNHFLLPGGRPGESSSQKYGLNLMELLINALLKRGARRERLQAKLFGGGRMIANMTNIGAQNGAFAVQFLADERIPVISKSLGGDQARKLRFWPASGRAQQMLLARAANEEPITAATPAPASTGDLDLF